MSEKETELEKATESGRISEADAADLSAQDKARKHRKTAKAYFFFIVMILPPGIILSGRRTS